MLKKSVISLISYDADMLPESIKSYYNYVDEIILGLDKDRITWSGNKFSFDESTLWKALKAIDSDSKIKIIEDNFHAKPVALDNDNYERNVLKSYCTHDWIFSFDADEILVSPAKFFVEFLPIVEPYYNTHDLVFTWFLPFKQFIYEVEENGNKTSVNDTLMIGNEQGNWFSGDKQGFATSKDSEFNYCRWTNKQKRLATPLCVMHYSFCRAEKDLEFKLNNFGHSDKTNSDPFFHNWRVCDLSNYQMLRNFKSSNFNPAQQWHQLLKVPTHMLSKLAEMQSQHVY